MNSILYVSDTQVGAKTGHGYVVSTHYKMLQDIYKDKMYTCIVGDGEDSENHKYYSRNNKLKQALSLLRGFPPYFKNKMLKDIFSMIDLYKISIVFFEDSISGKIIKKIKKRYPKIKVMVYFPDIEKVLMSEQFNRTSFLRSQTLNVLIKNEELTVKYSDYQMVLTKRDWELYERVYGKRPSLLLPVLTAKNQVAKNQGIHKKNKMLNILFVGVDYIPNVEGVEWFINNVIPKLQCEYQFNIVGYNMEKYRTKWENDKIKVRGTVESVVRYYEEADLVVAPIFSGGGMKVKTAEALSYGKIVLGTLESTIGYWDLASELKNVELFRCNNTEDFVKQIQYFAETEYSRFRINAYNWSKSNCSLEYGKNQLKQLLESSDE